MSLLACCVYDTDANDRLKYTKQCMESLLDTVDLKKHRVFIINNGSSEGCRKFLQSFYDKYDHLNIQLITLSENIGTARGINMALLQRNPGEICYKFDNDVTWQTDNWVDEMDRYMKPDIGVLGAKRIDVWQHPKHENLNYRTKMEGKLEICNDIIGTCTALNPAMLDKVGFYIQASPFYSFDDSLMNVRSIAAGFRNAFLPHIKITHLDDGKNPYTQWKKEEANKYLCESCELMDFIKDGTVGYYYDYN